MPYMSKEVGRKLTRLMIFGMICLLMVVGYVFWQSYKARFEIVDAQRQACERGKLDRVVNARGWRIAEDARRADGQFKVANKYKEIAISLEDRASIDCQVVFPDPSFFP